MLKLRNEKAMQLEFWQACLPSELFALGEELSRVDRILSDERFLEPFRKKFNSKVGRPTIPVEVYVRLMYLKFRYDLGYETLCKEVSDSISWRTFCKLSLTDRVPDPTTLMKLTKKYGDIVEELNRSLLQKAKEEKVIRSKKVRVDTTVIESNIHHPTDASLVSDGVRKLTRLMKKAATSVKVSDRSRSIKKRLCRIGNILRQKGVDKIQAIDRITREVISIGESVVKKARVVLSEASGRIAEELLSTLCVVEKVISQGRQVVSGKRIIPDRIVSIHDPGARPIKKGSIRHPVQFGRKVSLSESEEGFITSYRVYEGNPSDSEVLIDAVRRHADVLGVPRELSADRGMSSSKNEASLESMGVKRVCLPKKGKKTEERKALERSSWFSRLRRWRAGIEPRIGLLKRKYGLARSLWLGQRGTTSWVGLGVFAHNIDRFAKTPAVAGQTAG